MSDISRTTEPRQLSVITMLSYGIGEAAGACKNIAWGVLLLFYYQQVVGVEAALVGLAIAMSVVVAYVHILVHLDHRFWKHLITHSGLC